MRFYNVITIVPGKERECIADLVRLKNECGVDTFAAMVPFHPECPPLLRKTEEFMARYRAVRDAVASRGIRGGILVQSLINHGDRATPETNVPFTKITGADGVVCDYCFCPLDRDFQDYVRDIVTLMARETPEFILLDDDYRMSNHWPVKNGCFCDLHMRAFNQKYGCDLTREQLALALAKTDAAAVKLMKEWHQVLLGGLVEMCRVVRRAMDDVNPAIRGGTCMPGREADTIGEITRALAGKNRPLVRVNNANYLESHPAGSAMVLLRAGRMKRYIPGDAEVISESDTCPHHLYSMSANALRHHLAASLLGGVEGAKLWITDLRNGETGEGETYRRMLAASRGFFNTLGDFVKTVAWQGPSVTYPPQSVQAPVEANADNPFGENGCAWGNLLIRLGIPFVEVEQSSARLLAGDAPLRFARDALESFFKGGLILDGAAAKYLSDMGFAEHMGVKVENAKLRYSHETFDPADSMNGAVGGMHLAASHRFEQKRLTPLSPKVRIPSNYVAQPWFQADRAEIVAPAVTAYANALGGRVAVFAQPLGKDNGAFLNPRRRAQMAGLVDWVCGSPRPHALHGQSCAMLHGAVRGGRERVAVFINYCPDPVSPLMLRMPDAGRLTEIRQLADDGTWRAVKFEVGNDDRVSLPIAAAMRDVVVLRIS